MKNIHLNGLERYFQQIIFCENFFEEYDIYGQERTPIHMAFHFNKSLEFNLSNDQLDYLIKNSNLYKYDGYNYSVLMYAIIYNKSENLNLTEEQFDYLIYNTDINKKNIHKDSILEYAIKYKEFLTKKQLVYIIINSNYNNKMLDYVLDCLDYLSIEELDFISKKIEDKEINKKYKIRFNNYLLNKKMNIVIDNKKEVVVRRNKI